MITKFSTLFFSFWMLTVSAQQNYQSIVASIFKNADTDFVEIMGKKLPETEAGYTDYESKVKLSDETDLIIKKNNSPTTFYYHVSTYRYKESLENAVYLYITEHFPDSEFDIEREDMGYDGAYYKMSVFRKDDDYPFIVMSLTSDVSINTQFTLSVYGKSSVNMAITIHENDKIVELK